MMARTTKSARTALLRLAKTLAVKVEFPVKNSSRVTLDGDAIREPYLAPNAKKALGYLVDVATMPAGIGGLGMSFDEVAEIIGLWDVSTKDVPMAYYNILSLVTVLAYQDRQRKGPRARARARKTA